MAFNSKLKNAAKNAAKNASDGSKVSGTTTPTTPSAPIAPPSTGNPIKNMISLGVSQMGEKVHKNLVEKGVSEDKASTYTNMLKLGVGGAIGTGVAMTPSVGGVKTPYSASTTPSTPSGGSSGKDTLKNTLFPNMMDGDTFSSRTKERVKANGSFGAPSAPSTPSGGSSGSVVSYSDFLKAQEKSYGTIRDDTIDFYDDQNQKEIEKIESDKTSDYEYAENQKLLTDTAATDQKNADVSHANATYDTDVTTATTIRDKGYEYNDASKELVINSATEARDASYESAASDRESAVKRADVERERGVVDARSSYEQNKASYGANAEMLASMGLTGSGYGDYLNSRAYSQMRSETQNANALADKSKREAHETENRVRREADALYNQQVTGAEKEHLDKKYDIDTTYETNINTATHNRDDSIYAAEGKERDTKLQSDLTYNTNIHNADQKASDAIFESNQKADAGKFGANMSYEENILKNNEKIATHELEEQQRKEDKAEKATETARNAYTTLLSGANTGEYSADQLKQLAADYGLSPEQTQSLLDAAQGYTDKVEEGKVSDQNLSYDSFASGIKDGDSDGGSIQRAFDRGDISPTQYEDLKTQWNNNVDTSPTFFRNDQDQQMSKSAAQNALNSVINDPLCSPETKTALQAEFDKMYKPKTNGIIFNKDGNKPDMSKSGKNFSVKDINGNKYRVETGGVCDNKEVTDAASSVGNNNVFGYQGNLYIKKDGKVYSIEKRPSSGSYNDLYAAFYQ